ncbi:MAG: restriction endonuclease subunit S, partial [Parvibaculales bacterium]
EKQKSRFGIVKLVNVCDLCNGFAFKSSKFVNDGTPILRISNIQNGEISTDKSVYANQSDYKEDLGRYWVNDGDLLLAMSGATTGKVGINKTGLGFYLNQRVGLLRPKENLLTEYLFYFLSTKVEQNLSISAGAAQPNLSSKQIYEIEIPAVDIETQKSFLRVVEELFNQTSSLERLYSKKLDNLNALKSAILKQAFAGELIKDAA